MKPGVALFLLSLAVLIVASFQTRAEPTAWMSLSRTEVTCDMDELPTGPVWVYVHLKDIDEYTGAHVMVAWGTENINPDEHCYELLMVDVPVGEGFDCLWMNRGWSVLEVDTVQCASDVCYVPFDFTLTEPSPCNNGIAFRLLFDFSGCSGDEAGHICLMLVFPLANDGWFGADAEPMSSIVILGGGGIKCPCCHIAGHEGCSAYCPGCSHVALDKRSTWGQIKAMYGEEK